MNAFEGLGALIEFFFGIALLILFYVLIILLIYGLPILILVLLVRTAYPKRKGATSARRPIATTRALTDAQLLLGIAAALLAFVCYGLLDLGQWLTRQWRKRT